MKLFVNERLSLMSILPKESDFITLKIVRKLKETLSFNEKEVADLEFQYELTCQKCKDTVFSTAGAGYCKCGGKQTATGNIVWTLAKDTGKEVVLGKKATEICEAALKKLNDATPPKLTEQYFSLYEKFIGGDEEE